MAIRPDIRDQAYQFFVQEAPELLQIVETELLALRYERSRERVHTLMRAAHSIKGGAASVSLKVIQQLAHQLEDCFRSLYNEELKVTDELEQLLLEGYDCLRYPLLEAIRLGNHFDGSEALIKAEPVFSQLKHLLGEFFTDEDQLPTVAEMGIDIILNIFEADVATALRHLEALRQAHTSPALIAPELRAQAEVFMGLGELFDLPGWIEIAQFTLQALEHHPQQAREIIDLALQDFWQAHQQVLAGDRNLGGSASAELRALALAPSALETLPQLELSELSWLDSEGIGENSLTHQTNQVTPPDWELGDSIGLNSVQFALPETEAFNLENPPGDPDWLLPEIDLQTDPEQQSEKTFDDWIQDRADYPTSLHSTPANLANALNDLQATFATLPPAHLPTPKSATLSTNLLSRDQDPRLEPVSQPITEIEQQLSVRLNLSQLERMNNQLGEIDINRNSLSLQNENLQATLQELLKRFEKFRGIAQQLRQQGTKLLIHPFRQASAFQVNTNWLNSAAYGQFGPLSGQFDSLELDHYSDIQNLMQNAVDSILQLEETVEDVTLFAEQSDLTLEKQRQLLGGLRNELMWARMLPLNTILSRFPRLLRDLSSQYQKPIDLKLSGTGVLIDKAVLEKLYDPLVHLIRNAFDHGVEDQETRRQHGKSEQGSIQIRAYHRGNRTFIEVQDDGAGFDVDRIRHKVRQLGWMSDQEADSASLSRLLDMVFEPGFSTRDTVTELSGRGVGLDIVKGQLQALKGSITVSTAPQRGTTFTLRIPLTLGVAKLLVVWTGQTLAALPADGLEEILIPQDDAIKQSGGNHFLSWRDQRVPIWNLQNLLPYQCPIPELPSQVLATSVPTPTEWAEPLLLIRQGGQVYALRIQRVITEQELVIKPVSSVIKSPAYLYGCTILGDGTLVPVLEVLTLIDEQQKQGIPIHAAAPLQSSIGSALPGLTHQLSTILIVDDSVGMRQTLTLSLQKAGYRVIEAAEGRAAIDQLRQNPQIQLVICDIEMPVMNGFEFLSLRRQDSILSQVPVVMLTSRSGDKHRLLALQLGAIAYFTKPYTEQQFLSEIHHLLQSAVS
ncbi:MAG: hybrid sensor histidine kinase/response regulator [Synechococcaceae cyanobacterium SM2_3_2]|nr:hybrid sensor histidine kinase/response regulator [Synechococcaceae cyanobacterium SM2_3_2]